MDVREKLVELLGNIYLPMMDGHNTIGEYNIPHKFKEKIADYLISNGVTVQENVKMSDELLKQLKNAPITLCKSEPSIETVQEWISVTDRLPENGVHVLICCEMRRYGGEIAGKYVCDGYYAEANKIIAGDFPDECNCEYSEEDDEFYLREGWYEVVKNWDDFNSVAVEDFVTHWMPLPNQPKGE